MDAYRTAQFQSAATALDYAQSTPQTVCCLVETRSTMGCLTTFKCPHTQTCENWLFSLQENYFDEVFDWLAPDLKNLQLFYREKPGFDCDHFVLIAAMNPCPCGFYGDSQKPCSMRRR
jgi:hypothetical protein